jgi:sulfoxide reductase heme-binding subunit YedZ
MMLWRVLPEMWRRRIVVYPLLALVAGCTTAAVEFTWYGVATAINPWRVLAANESIAFGLRPAHWVFVVALGMALLVAARRMRLPARASSTSNA